MVQIFVYSQPQGQGQESAPSSGVSPSSAAPEAGQTINLGQLLSGPATTAGAQVARPGGGAAAFLDIHYGKSGLGGQAGRPGAGAAAFLDIHYGKGGLAGQLPGIGESAAAAPEAGQTINLSQLLSGSVAAAGTQVAPPGGGAAAFLDIHYGKSGLGGQAGRPGGGAAAFLDIHYGKSGLGGQAERPGAGAAAFLDIHYGKGGLAGQLPGIGEAAPSQGQSVSPSSAGTGGTGKAPSRVALYITEDGRVSLEVED